MSVLTREIKKCKHDDCPLPVSRKRNVNYRFCAFYLKLYDGCEY